ncbi:structural origins of high-affinity biotin binding To Streptavidin [Favolaschia claudopus]|uniref:Structural origins of high-affinity biotin binding To Streptavidin n=1 Tax=Favolaschia claudopus TaxID=2862362 RepID=A0AAV9ZGG3_9AGAR
MSPTFDPRSLSGYWQSEPGSAADLNYEIYLKADNDCGLTGYMIFKSQIGNMEIAFPLNGRYDPSVNSGGGIVLSWVVKGRLEELFMHSTTIWSAQYFAEENKLVTQWLLMVSTKPKDFWNSANVGSAVYSRVSDLDDKALAKMKELGESESLTQGAHLAFDYTKLNGTWYNELHSSMTLTADKYGNLTGTYTSSVGNAESDYSLAGRFDLYPPHAQGVSLGWSVAWKNAKKGDVKSSTAWGGLYFPEVGAAEGGQIQTHWLLNVSAPENKLWMATNLGSDVFTRREKPRVAEAEFSLTTAHPSIEEIVAKGEKIAQM